MSDTIAKGVVVNLGQNTTLSPPFVTADAVYFRGINNELFKSSIQDNGATTRLNEESTVTTPFVYGDRVFFMGVDNALKSVSTNGTDPKDYGQSTASAPWVNQDFIVFRGTDDRLLRCDHDGGSLHDYGVSTISSPSVDRMTIYFQGTDNRLLKIGLKVGEYHAVHDAEVDGAVAVDESTRTVVYRERSDENHKRKRWVPIGVPGAVPVGGEYYPDQNLMVIISGQEPRPLSSTVDHVSPSPPFASDGWIYFRGAHTNALLRCRNDGEGLEQIAGSMQTWSTPGGYKGQIAWQGVDDNKLWYVDLS